MARILLIHPGLNAKDGNYYTIMPMGLISIGDKLEKDKHEVRILNLGLEKKLNKSFSLEKYLDSFKPDFVGVDMHWYPYIYDSIEVAMICKSKGAVVILGGLTASIFAKDILERFPFVDGVIVGQGEIPFSELVKNWNKDKSLVPNLVYKNGEKILLPSKFADTSENIDRLEFYNFDLIENKDFYLKTTTSTGNFTVINSKYIPKKFYFLFVGRGCSMFCSNCCANSYNFKKIGIDKPLFRSPKRVVRDILNLQNMGFDLLYIQFDPKPFSEKFYDELFDELRAVRHKLNMGIVFGSWGGSIPSDNMIKNISQMFCPEMSTIEISPESAVERIRRMNGRGNYSNDEIIESINKIKRKKIHVCCFLSAGFPFEGPEDAYKTIEFAKYLIDLDVSASFFPPNIEPGSPAWYFPERYKITLFRKTFDDFMEYSIMLKDCIYPEHPIGYETHLLKEKEIMELEMKAYSELYLNRKFILNRFKYSVRSSDRILPKITVFSSIIFKNYKLIWMFKKS
ncbi:MAG: radical SAM protein [Candidatus Calescibacterium sp.]|nr:radical SAM protein [Candidatus Calescibacterium sp.]MCX7733579.1 radical SAM protein [bacterium]